jgi:hypothetical protein
MVAATLFSVILVYYSRVPKNATFVVLATLAYGWDADSNSMSWPKRGWGVSVWAHTITMVREVEVIEMW